MSAPHVPTRDRKLLVRNLVAFGCDQKYIASQLGIEIPQLRELYAEELEFGAADAVHKVAQRLFTIATTGDAKEAIPAAIFWLKTKAGWKEPAKELELSGKGGKDLNFVGRDELLAQLADELDDKPKKPSVN